MNANALKYINYIKSQITTYTYIHKVYKAEYYNLKFKTKSIG